MQHSNRFVQVNIEIHFFQFCFIQRTGWSFELYKVVMQFTVKSCFYEIIASFFNTLAQTIYCSDPLDQCQYFRLTQLHTEEKIFICCDVHSKWTYLELTQKNLTRTSWKMPKNEPRNFWVRKPFLRKLETF